MRFSRNRPTQKLAYLVVKSKARAVLAARVLQGAEIELLPLRSLLEAATRISTVIDHVIGGRYTIENRPIALYVLC